ncbi:hypothetical protein PG994_007962 [Apiospora phragmitis]|uniref:Uncharacterized protein n=1 Tax=Apiospora phragmitis TaxID=2905665 RepID=A0ABR1UU44_9PEZI
MKSSFITTAASLLMSFSPAVLARPSQQEVNRLLPSRNASPEPLDLGNVGDAFKDGWGKVEDGFDKVGDWFKDLPQEVKDLNDTVGDMSRRPPRTPGRSTSAAAKSCSVLQLWRRRR